MTMSSGDRRSIRMWGGMLKMVFEEKIESVKDNEKPNSEPRFGKDMRPIEI